MNQINIGDWVKESRKNAGLTQEQLAEALNLSGKASISAMELNRSTPSYMQILKIAELCQVAFPHEFDQNREQREQPQSPTDDEYVLIRQYTAKGECGVGEFNEHVEVSGGLSFKRSWLAALGLKPGNLEVIYATGDSMSPTITDGAVVLIDVSQAEPREGKVFAIIRHGNGLVLKRLSRDREGCWIYCSDNTNRILYPDLFPMEEDHIIGRVVWQGGTGGL